MSMLLLQRSVSWQMELMELLVRSLISGWRGSLEVASPAISFHHSSRSFLNITGWWQRQSAAIWLDGCLSTQLSLFWIGGGGWRSSILHFHVSLTAYLHPTEQKWFQGFFYDTFFPPAANVCVEWDKRSFYMFEGFISGEDAGGLEEMKIIYWEQESELL